ncbi:MAG: endonuclease domain-containing protein [Sphingomonas bacterium]|nr:endonuclease domain-containing protein [Sphingomonas bacterium]
MGNDMPTEATLLAHANHLRKNTTEPETRLWRHLSNTQNGYKFRRQHVIAPFICDFFCPTKGLIVEIDGHTHDDADDACRDAAMARQGFATLRFTNIDVMTTIVGVVMRIVVALDPRPARWAGVPHPTPPPEGEGLSRSKLLPFRGGVSGGRKSSPDP